MNHISLKKLLTKTNEETKRKILVDCSEALAAYNRNVRFYRGDTSFFKEVEYIDPRNSERKSKNTNNIFTTLVKGSGQWEKAGIPLRNKSVLFSTSSTGAEGYSGRTGIYLVLPVNGANVGYGNDTDNWGNYQNAAEFLFKDRYIDVAGFCDILKDFLRHTVGDYDATECGKGTDYEFLKSCIERGSEKVDDYLKDGGDYKSKYHMEKLKRMIDATGSVWDGCLKYIDPTFNEIQHRKLTELPYTSETTEMWTDSPCYFIHRGSEAFTSLGIFPDPAA